MLVLAVVRYLNDFSLIPLLSGDKEFHTAISYAESRGIDRHRRTQCDCLLVSQAVAGRRSRSRYENAVTLCIDALGMRTRLAHFSASSLESDAEGSWP